MKWIVVLSLLIAGFVPARAQTMEATFAENCPRSVLADAATVRLHCSCVHRQIMETTVFPEDREASFALIGPAQTLTQIMEHGKALANLPQDLQRAMDGRRQAVLQVIVPLCLLSAATGKVQPNGTIQK